MSRPAKSFICNMSFCLPQQPILRPSSPVRFKKERKKKKERQEIRCNPRVLFPEHHCQANDFTELGGISSNIRLSYIKYNMWETTVFPGEERKAVSLGGDCVESSGRKTTRHDKKMFFKTWHQKWVLFVLNVFSGLANGARGEHGGRGKRCCRRGLQHGASRSGLCFWLCHGIGLPVRLSKAPRGGSHRDLSSSAGLIEVVFAGFIYICMHVGSASKITNPLGSLGEALGRIWSRKASVHLLLCCTWLLLLQGTGPGSFKLGCSASGDLSGCSLPTPVSAGSPSLTMGHTYLYHKIVDLVMVPLGNS